MSRLVLFVVAMLAVSASGEELTSLSCTGAQIEHPEKEIKLESSYEMGALYLNRTVTVDQKQTSEETFLVTSLSNSRTLQIEASSESGNGSLYLRGGAGFWSENGTRYTVLCDLNK